LVYVPDWLGFLILAHFICIGLGMFDLDRRIRRRVRPDFPNYMASGVMAGAIAILLVPILGEAMWFYLRRRIDQF